MHAADSVPNTRRCVNSLRVPKRVFSSRLNLHLFKMQTLTAQIKSLSSSTVTRLIISTSIQSAYNFMILAVSIPNNTVRRIFPFSFT